MLYFIPSLSFILIIKTHGSEASDQALQLHGPNKMRGHYCELFTRSNSFMLAMNYEVVSTTIEHRINVSNKHPTTIGQHRL